MNSALRFLLATLAVFGFLSAGSLQAQTPEAKVQQETGKPQDKPLTDAQILGVLHSHCVPHVVFEPQISPDAKINELVRIYNVNVLQWVALGLMLLIFLPVRFSFGKSGQPAWIVRVFRGWCHWIRDDMVYAVMGEEEGRAFAPFFIYVFFFVCFMNCVGLIPSAGKWLPTAMATGTPYVTGALAIVTLLLMLVFGMKKNGVFGFWKGLIPHGIPSWLLVIMVPIELVGLIIKPFALTVRLFANMLAGHLIIASLIGLIFVFQNMLPGWLGYLPAIPAVGMATFVFIIESFVTLLQAYIFTYLSIVFLHQAMHQEH